MKNLLNNLNLTLSFLFSSGLLLSAYLMEFYFSLIQCDLCIKQRIIHACILILTILIIFFYKIFWSKFLMILILNCLWLISSILAFYHFGIEKGLWEGLSECSSKLTFNENTLNQIFSKSPIRCDEPQFEIFNISLAGWNGFLSLLIFIIFSFLLYKTYEIKNDKKIR